MRIWDISPAYLCKNHLLGEHRELHALWTILTQDKKGYRHHPETKRWIGKLGALYLRHNALVSEMKTRGYMHKSSLEKKYANGKNVQNEYVNTIEEQYAILKTKKCDCLIRISSAQV